MAKVDVILRGGVVVTMNPAFDVWQKGAVAVRGREIVAVGPAEEISAAYEAAEVLDCTGQAVIPGLINAHTHVPMSLLRGMADDLRLDVWLLGYMMPVEREFVGPEYCRVGTLLSCAEMIRSGTTCFCDMYYFEDEVAQATAGVGLRAILGETILKFPSPDAASYDESLAYCRDFIERWRGHELIVPAVAPHAAYTSTVEMLQQSAALARQYDVPLLTHFSETAEEVEESRRLHGQTPVEYVNGLGLLEARVIAAHCVHVTEPEMRLLARKRVGVSHNPTSNLKLASGVAPVLRLRQAGVAVGIGTDGPGSNNDQDMFEEMRLAALLPKGVSYNPMALPARDTFAMATIEGARALKLDWLIGSLEPGKRADIAVVDLQGPHLTPRFALGPGNIYSQLVYAAKASDVRHVLVNGRFLMRERQLLTLDEAAVLAEAQRIAERINDFVYHREQSLLDKLVALGGLQREETYEIQVKVPIADLLAVEQRLSELDVELLKRSTRQQFDTYFLFDDPQKGSVRYREDNVLLERSDEMGRLGPALDVAPEYDLTLLGPTREREYENSVILSRSRFTSPAAHSLRFYREYFQPDHIKEIVKWRTRYRILYQGEEFAINLDKLSRPAAGTFLEIKSRTWSQADALKKAGLIGELLELLGVERQRIIRGEYVTF
ncbi:MAG: amidohydrolase family protein [Anaerolineae bacterium]|nr:amidohydrolase family protein [Anaerolineae bacterium]